jgi:hypothetical protein
MVDYAIVVAVVGRSVGSGALAGIVGRRRL